jgi:hypothetical protein
MKQLTIIFLALFSLTLSAETKIETIDLKHQLATEVLPYIQAFLPKESTARAFQNTIIIKAEPATITEIKQLIQQLDKPFERLKITVIKTDLNLTDQQQTQTSAKVKVTKEDLEAGVKIHHWSTKNNRDRDQQYRAQGIAGRPISIFMGQDVPQHQQLIFIGSNGDMAVESNTSYISLRNGFQAVARLIANQQVQVDIHPIFQTLSKQNGTIEQSQVITTLVGPTGQWLELGYVSEEENIDQYGVKRYHSNQSQQQKLYMKVEPITVK